MILGSVLIALPQMRGFPKKRNVIALLLLPFLMIGCVGMRLDNGESLIARDDFSTAVQAAPHWVEAALEVIAELEHRLESQ
tara:strand:+ start:3798 stop:4040 length:243 start_codon:yes stop_codon:yes gene_type:complete